MTEQHDSCLMVGKVYVVFYSKNKNDDVCDSSIHAIYNNEDSARLEVLRMREEQKSARSYDNYHYYYDEYGVSI